MHVDGTELELLQGRHRGWWDLFEMVKVLFAKWRSYGIIKQLQFFSPQKKRDQYLDFFYQILKTSSRRTPRIITEASLVWSYSIFLSSLVSQAASQLGVWKFPGQSSIIYSVSTCINRNNNPLLLFEKNSRISKQRQWYVSGGAGRLEINIVLSLLEAI